MASLICCSENSSASGTGPMATYGADVDASTLRSRCAAHRLKSAAQQLRSDRMALRHYVHDTVPGMTASSGFPADSGLRTAEHGPEVRVVTVVGEVAGPTGLELAHSLISELSVARVVIVDLDGVQLLGSAGLSALFEANELAIGQGRTLRLVCHSRIATRAMEAAGFRECFTFADSVPEALNDSRHASDVVEVEVARPPYRRRSRRLLQRDSTVSRRAATPRGRQTPAMVRPRPTAEALKCAACGAEPVGGHNAGRAVIRRG